MTKNKKTALILGTVAIAFFVGFIIRRAVYIT
ncbi:cytochrome oxidase small assembly protein [Burkholderiales bacterium]|nr:cytochrome oxidase small assembly protein [Burkholderiales bacterium]